MWRLFYFLTWSLVLHQCISNDNENNNYYIQKWIEPTFNKPWGAPTPPPHYKYEEFSGDHFFATISINDGNFVFLGPTNYIEIYSQEGDTPPLRNFTCQGCLASYIQTGSLNPSNFITLDRFLYFSSKGSGNSQNNFYIYDSAKINYAKFDFGDVYENYTKPFATSDECYATDGEKYIYIIGGQSSADLKTFSILNTITNTFTIGPNLNHIRTGSACIYSNSNDKLYVFGGTYSKTIEKYDDDVTSSLWQMVNATMSQNTYSISAFMIPESNTVFIIGGNAGNEICNQFFVDTERVYLCPKRPKQFPNYSPLYIEDLQRFWTFGGDGDFPANKSLQYVEPNQNAPISLTASSININIGQNVPVLWNVNKNYINILNDTCNFTLYSEALNISNFISINPINGECDVCDSSKSDKCWPCSIGLFPEFEQIDEAGNIYDIIETNVFYMEPIIPQLTYCLVNSFYITLNDILSINISLPRVISTTISQKIPISFTGYILQQYTKYQWLLSSSTPNAAKIDHLLTVITSSNNIKSCTIMDRNTSEISTCDDGFEPNTLNYTRIAENNSTFNVMFNASNGNASNVRFYPHKSIPIMVEDLFIHFANNTIKLQPGGRVTINISNYALESDQLYQFDLQSSNSKVIINYLLNIETGNSSTERNGTAIIKHCYLGSNNEPNPTPCHIGIKPIIEYDDAFDSFKIFITPSIITNLNSKYVYISPQKGINCKLTMCEPGYGIRDLTIANCELCPSGEFTLVYGLTPCVACKSHDSSDLKGIQCFGSNQVEISYNYWASAVSVNNSNLYPLIDILENDEIYVAFCPPGYCCTNINGCNYINDYNELCNNGRNVNSSLCGQCKSGLSELFGSTACGKCSKTNYLFFFLVFIFIVFPFVIYIAYFESVPKYNWNENENKSENENDDDDDNKKTSKGIELFSTLMFDIGVYYFQSLSIILLSSGITVSSTFESVILSFFSLSPSSIGNNGSNGWCIIANLTSFGKLLTNLFFPLMIIPCLIFLAIINKKTDLTLADLLCFSCYKLNCFNDIKSSKFYNWLNRRAFIFKCCLRILLLYAGTALSTLFQIITFIKLGDGKIVHFYSPTKQIDAASLVLSIFFIMIIITIFGIIWYNLYKQTNKERYDSRNHYQKIVLSFKQNKWYWQFIILFRRCIIAILNALKYISPNIFNLILTGYLIIYIIIHIEIKPFYSKIANNVETLCLLSLILILLCLNFNIETGQFFNIFISICIGIPFISFVIFGIICIYQWIKSDDNCFKKHILSNSINSKQKYIKDASVALLGKGEEEKYENKEEILLTSMDDDNFVINEIEIWLKEIGDEYYENYYNLFIKHGFDTMELMKTLTDNDLKDVVGIQKLGHRRKILIEIQK